MRALVGCFAAVLLLAGCTGKPAPEPTSRSSQTAHNDSDMELSGRRAYERYLEVVDEVFREGGARPERLETVAGGAQLQVQLDASAEIAGTGLRSIGRTRLVSFHLQSYETGSDGTMLTAYACEDISGVDVLNAQGQSVVQSERAEQALFEVRLESEGSILLVTGKEIWTDGSC